MSGFITSRVQSSDVGFWEPIPKLNIPSFRSLSKRTAVNATTQREKLLTVNADRQLFGRLHVAAKTREINIKDVLCYEVCSVPPSLSSTSRWKS